MVIKCTDWFLFWIWVFGGLISSSILADVLEQMQAVDRETAILLMQNIVENLGCQEFQHEYMHVLKSGLPPHPPRHLHN